MWCVIINWCHTILYMWCVIMCMSASHIHHDGNALTRRLPRLSNARRDQLVLLYYYQLPSLCPCSGGFANRVSAHWWYSHGWGYLLGPWLSAHKGTSKLISRRRLYAFNCLLRTHGVKLQKEWFSQNRTVPTGIWTVLCS